MTMFHVINCRNFLASAVLLVLIIAESRADLVLFDERSEFEAASPVLTTEGFNTDFGDDAPTVDFQAFTVMALGGVGNGLVRWTDSDQFRTEGSGAIFAADFTVPVSLDFTTRFTFDQPINAFGIDVTDVNGPTRLLLRVASQEFELLPAAGGEDVRRTRFIGLISDEPVTQVDFAWNRAQDGIGFDFLQYGAVPEPWSFAVLGLFWPLLLKRPDRRETHVSRI